MVYRTRYRIALLYYEVDGETGKCIRDTPSLIKKSGAYDGDVFKETMAMIKEIYEMVPKKCIIKEESGICVITYVMKEKFVYHTKVFYVFKKDKNNRNLAYQGDSKTGKLKRHAYKAAIRKDKAQQRRSKKAEGKHRVSKKKVVKQFQVYKGCTSPDMNFLAHNKVNEVK